MRKQTIRELYPYNVAILDYLRMCSKNDQHAAISVPSGIGTRFALLHFMHERTDLQFLYLTANAQNHKKMKYHEQRSCGFTLENVTYMTYGEFTSSSPEQQKTILLCNTAVILNEYMNIPGTLAERRKLAKRISQATKLMIIGVTSLRERDVMAGAPETLAMHNAFFGEKDGYVETPLLEFFDIRQACLFGNFEFPIYCATDLNPKNKMKSIIRQRLQDQSDDATAGRLARRYAYYPTYFQCEPAQDYIRNQFKNLDTSKVIVLVPYRKTCKYREMITAQLDSVISVQWFSWTEQKEQAIHDFETASALQLKAPDHLFFLEIPLCAGMDLNLEDCSMTILAYAAKEDEFYQALNLCMSYGKGKKVPNPKLLDLFACNSVSQDTYDGVAYGTPSSRLQKELGAGTGEDIQLYYDDSMKSVKAFATLEQEALAYLTTSNLKGSF